MDQLKAMLMEYQGWQAYGFFYAVIAACGFGLPMNSDSILIASAVLAAVGFFDIKILIFIAFLALISGDSVTFWISRLAGEKIRHKKWFKKILPDSRLNQARAFLEKRGQGFLFFIRFMPLIRTALWFTAGTIGVKPRTFYLMNGTSTVLYLPLLMGSSFVMAENIDVVVRSLKEFQFVFLGIFAIGVAVLVFQKKKKSKSRA